MEEDVTFTELLDTSDFFSLEELAILFAEELAMLLLDAGATEDDDWTFMLLEDDDSCSFLLLEEDFAELDDVAFTLLLDDFAIALFDDELFLLLLETLSVPHCSSSQ